MDAKVDTQVETKVTINAENTRMEGVALCAYVDTKGTGNAAKREKRRCRTMRKRRHKSRNVSRNADINQPQEMQQKTRTEGTKPSAKPSAKPGRDTGAT